MVAEPNVYYDIIVMSLQQRVMSMIYWLHFPTVVLFLECCVALLDYTVTMSYSSQFSHEEVMREI